MRVLATTVAVLLAALIESTGGQSPAPPYPPWDVVVVAHRGLSAGFPENTLAAFRNAITGGVEAIELDLRGTADDEIVVLHDETVDRTTNGRGEVERMTLAQVKRLDAGRHAGVRFSGERVPTYQEVLELAGTSGVHLLLDIKQGGRLSHERVVRLTERHAATLRVIVGVRSVEDLREFRALNPNLRTLGFVPDVESIGAFAAAGIDIIRLWPEWIAADAGLVARVHALGTPVWVTAGRLSREGLDTLIRQRVNGILTDLPEVLAPLVADVKGRAHTPQSPVR